MRRRRSGRLPKERERAQSLPPTGMRRRPLRLTIPFVVSSRWRPSARGARARATRTKPSVGSYQVVQARRSSLVVAVEHVGDVVDLLGAWGGVAGGGPQVGVAQAGAHNVHRQAARARRSGPGGRSGRPRRAACVPPGRAGWAAGRAEEDGRSAGSAVDELELRPGAGQLRVSDDTELARVATSDR